MGAWPPRAWIARSRFPHGHTEARITIEPPAQHSHEARSMKHESKSPFATLLALLLIAALVAVLLTHGWADDARRLRAMQVAARASSEAIDMRPLETAQQMAALAVTHSEQDYARDALRSADRCVDLAFAMAIQDAIANPAPQTPAAYRQIEGVASRCRKPRTILRRRGPESHLAIHRRTRQSQPRRQGRFAIAHRHRAGAAGPRSRQPRRRTAGFGSLRRGPAGAHSAVARSA